MTNIATSHSLNCFNNLKSQQSRNRNCQGLNKWNQTKIGDKSTDTAQFQAVETELWNGKRNLCWSFPMLEPWNIFVFNLFNVI